MTINHTDIMENEEQPNFNLGSSWDFSEEDAPNFDLGSSWHFSDEDMSNSDERPNFDLGSSWDISDDLFSDHEDMMSSDGEYDVDVQYGYGQDQEVSDRYVIEEIRNRNIPKFNVQGHDYRLRVNSLNQGLSYDEAVVILHGIIHGEL